MQDFVFSADAHIVEPPSIYADSMPAHLKAFTPNAKRDGNKLLMRIGEKVMHSTWLGEGSIDRPTKGQLNLDRRLEDMEADGISGELLFPTTALMTYFIEDPEGEAAVARIYNDWLLDHVRGRRDIWVPAAVLPVRSLALTLAELQRVAALGYTSAMLPVVAPTGTISVPRYNDASWDPIFAAAARLGVVLTLHTGTGQTSWIVERGPGGAIINYTLQMNDAATAIMYMVAGGVLDRHPTAQVAFIECGASWLAGLCERMDESHRGHNSYVRPPLSRLPSQIVRDQVKVAFQSDRACIRSRALTGHEPLIWGSDYPHMEGTYPHSQDYIEKMFEGVDISDKERADILGGTAARLFKLQRPEFIGAI